MRSRFPCLLLLPLVLTAGGCGFVHLGRLPEPTTTVLGDAKLMAENSELRLEKKMLQQELQLSRAQGDALRTAIENRTADGDTSRRLVQQLNETTRELSQLRATHARLVAERTGPAGAVAGGEAGGRGSGELNEELAKLRTELSQTREQNLTLTREVQIITQKHAQAQVALAQLNADLLSQREARQIAEGDVDLLRTELRAIAPNSSALAQLRSGAASEVRTLGPAPTPPPAAPVAAGPTVVTGETRRIELSAEPQVPLTSLTTKSSNPPVSGVSAMLTTRVSGGGERGPASPGGARTHVVAAGDTLAKIATRYYGVPGRWREILEANRDVLGEGNNLVVGHALRIP